MITIEVEERNILGNVVRVVDGKYIVLLDIMKILGRATNEGSWSESKRKILRHMSYDKSFKIIQMNIPIVRSDNRLCHNNTFVVHEQWMREVIFILKPLAYTKNYEEKMEKWKALYNVFQ